MKPLSVLIKTVLSVLCLQPYIHSQINLTKLPSIPETSIDDLIFVEDDIYLIPKYNSWDFCYKSVDQGISWDTFPLPYRVEEIKKLSDGTLIFHSGSGTIFTLDGNNVWNEYNFASGSCSVDVVNDTIYFASGSLFRAYDGSFDNLIFSIINPTPSGYYWGKTRFYKTDSFTYFANDRGGALDIAVYDKEMNLVNYVFNREQTSDLIVTDDYVYFFRLTSLHWKQDTIYRYNPDLTDLNKKPLLDSDGERMWASLNHVYQDSIYLLNQDYIYTSSIDKAYSEPFDKRAQNYALYNRNQQEIASSVMHKDRLYKKYSTSYEFAELDQSDIAGYIIPPMTHTRIDKMYSTYNDGLFVITEDHHIWQYDRTWKKIDIDDRRTYELDYISLDGHFYFEQEDSRDYECYSENVTGEIVDSLTYCPDKTIVSGEILIYQEYFYDNINISVDSGENWMTIDCGLCDYVYYEGQLITYELNTFPTELVVRKYDLSAGALDSLDIELPIADLPSRYDIDDIYILKKRSGELIVAIKYERTITDRFWEYYRSDDFGITFTKYHETTNYISHYGFIEGSDDVFFKLGNRDTIKYTYDDFATINSAFIGDQLITSLQYQFLYFDYLHNIYIADNYGHIYTDRITLDIADNNLVAQWQKDSGDIILKWSPSSDKVIQSDILRKHVSDTEYRLIGQLEQNELLTNMNWTDANITNNGIYYYQITEHLNNGRKNHTKVASVLVPEPLTEEIFISPNPFGNELNLTLPNHNCDNAEIILLDINNKIVSTQKINCNEKVSIETTNIYPGIYIINIILGNKSYTQKIVRI